LQRATDDGVGVEAEQVGCSAIDAHDALPSIDREHTLDHAAQHGFLLSPLPTNGKPSLDELFSKHSDRVGQLE
jgi:hypothetical protein